MNPLHIPATRTTPEIQYLPEQATFRVVGNSIPENTGTFYTPIVEWLQHHAGVLPNGCSFAFSLPYFNSSSLKALYMLLLEIKKGIDQGKGYSVTWYVEEEDEFMTEAGETYKEMLGLEINFAKGHL